MQAASRTFTDVGGSRGSRRQTKPFAALGFLVISLRHCRTSVMAIRGKSPDPCRGSRFTPPGPVGACISENARASGNSYLHGHQRVSAGRWRKSRLGACDGRRNILGARWLAAPFDVRPREFRRPFGEQERLERRDRAGLLTGCDHERRLVLVSGEDAAQGVAETGGGVQVYQAGVTVACA
jgi:hypothetical protein